MKKNLSRALAVAFAGAIAFTSFGLGSTTTVKADDPIPCKKDASANNVLDSSYVLQDATEVTFTVSGVESGTATLGLADAAWSYQDWESNTEISGDGTYTITAKTAEEAGAEINDGVVVFVVDIPVADAAFNINDTEYVVSDVQVNGEAVNFIYGDLEEKGNLRIEIYNEYGQTNGIAWKTYVADASANNAIDASYVLGDATEVSFDVAGVESATATLGLADAAWSYQDWESNTEISGDGTYTITAKTAEEAGAEINDGVVVFVVDIPVADAAFNVADTDYVVSNVTVNGEAVNFIYGDIEEKGNLRIEIYNEYGPTKTDESVWGDAAAEETAVVGDVDLDGTYGGYVAIQGPKYTFRDCWDNEGTGFGTDFFNQVTFQGDTSTGESVPATINDVVIAGNGTYTASITDIQFPDDEFDSQDYMNLIILSTDIPNTGAITVSDVVLTVNGSTVSDITPTQEEDCAYIKLNIQNIWSDIDTVKSIGYYNTPVTSVEITFTVSGFNYDAEVVEEAVEPETEVVAVDTTVSTKKAPVALFIILGVVVVAAIVVVIIVVTKKKKGANK